MYRLTKEDAYGIASCAMELKTNSVLDSTGYYYIYEEKDKEIVVDVSKADGYFAVYVSYEEPKESDWYYTDGMDVDELANLLMEISEKN